MSYFIPVLYKNKQYPQGIKPKMEEVSAHFDIDGIQPLMDYSLHTEYSFGKREYSNKALEGLDTIKSANRDGIPKLWFNENWSQEFAIYIKRLTKESERPKVIEIHPPFKDYCETMDKFVQIYKVFESYFPDTKIVIENREGTLYNSDFLLSKPKDLIELTNAIRKNNLRLRIVLDLPQLLHSERAKDEFLDKNKESEIRTQIKTALDKIRTCRDYIDGIHVWGQDIEKSGKVRSHFGDLNTFFISKELKEYFLKKVLETFDDGRARYFVPEVNSNEEDLKSVVDDFYKSGFKFI